MMWGHHLLLLRDQRVRRFATHASWRTRILEQFRQAHPMPLRHLSHLLCKRPPDRHREHVAVRTRPRTARYVRLCQAFRPPLGLCLGLRLRAALSPRLGGLVVLNSRVGKQQYGKYRARSA